MPWWDEVDVALLLMSPATCRRDEVDVALLLMSPATCCGGMRLMWLYC